MSDYLIRSLAREAGILGIVGVSTEVSREAARRHGATPIAAAALAVATTGGILLGALLKVQQRVALKVQANGPLEKLVVEADAYGRARSYVAQPDVPWPLPIGPDDVAQAIGSEGVLTVVKDLRLKHLYESVMVLQSGHLDRELTHYLNQSEQVPSVVEIGVHLDGLGRLAKAGGLLFQRLPGAAPNALDALSERLEDLPPLETLLADGHTPEEILAMAYGPVEYTVLQHQPLEFRCTCSRERSRQALLTLHPDELLDLLRQGEAVVDCHFCHERYVFGAEELAAIFDEVVAAKAAERSGPSEAGSFEE